MIDIFGYSLYSFKQLFLFVTKNFSAGIFYQNIKRFLDLWGFNNILWKLFENWKLNVFVHYIQKAVHVFLLYLSPKKCDCFSIPDFDPCKYRQNDGRGKKLPPQLVLLKKLRISSKNEYAIKGFSKAIWTVLFFFFFFFFWDKHFCFCSKFLKNRIRKALTKSIHSPRSISNLLLSKSLPFSSLSKTGEGL